MTFKMYLYLSLNFERELKSARSISQTSSIFVTVQGLRRNLFLTSCVKCTCSDLTANLQIPFSYFYSLLLTLLLTLILLEVQDRNRLYPETSLLVNDSHFLCVCKQLRNEACIFKSFFCFVLARGSIIYSLRDRLQEYLLISLSVLMSDHVLSGPDWVSNSHKHCIALYLFPSTTRLCCYI